MVIDLKGRHTLIEDFDEDSHESLLSKIAIEDKGDSYIFSFITPKVDFRQSNDQSYRSQSGRSSSYEILSSMKTQYK